MNEEKRIVAVVTFKVTPEDFARVSSEADTTLRRRLPTIPGFIEGMVLANESTTKVAIASEWKSRQNWAAAQWDEDIERAVADMFQETRPTNWKCTFHSPRRLQQRLNSHPIPSQVLAGFGRVARSSKQRMRFIRLWPVSGGAIRPNRCGRGALRLTARASVPRPGRRSIGPRDRSPPRAGRRPPSNSGRRIR